MSSPINRRLTRRFLSQSSGPTPPELRPGFQPQPQTSFHFPNYSKLQAPLRNSVLHHELNIAESTSESHSFPRDPSTAHHSPTQHIPSSNTPFTSRCTSSTIPRGRQPLELEAQARSQLRTSTCFFHSPQLPPLLNQPKSSIEPGNRPNRARHNPSPVCPAIYHRQLL